MSKDKQPIEFGREDSSNILNAFLKPAQPDQDMVEKIAEFLYKHSHPSRAKCIAWERLDKTPGGLLKRSDFYPTAIEFYNTIIQPALQSSYERGKEEKEAQVKQCFMTIDNLREQLKAERQAAYDLGG